MNKYYSLVIERIREDNLVRRATAYVSPNKIVRATRKFKERKGGNIEMVLTIGKPNFSEREVIKKAISDKKNFPLKVIYLKLYPLKKK